MITSELYTADVNDIFTVESSQKDVFFNVEVTQAGSLTNIN